MKQPVLFDDLVLALYFKLRYFLINDEVTPCSDVILRAFPFLNEMLNWLVRLTGMSYYAQ
jgi:hypothetical protein